MLLRRSSTFSTSLPEQLPIVPVIGAEIPLRRACGFSDDADQHIKGVYIRVKGDQALQHLWDMLFHNERFLLLKPLHQIAGLAVFAWQTSIRRILFSASGTSQEMFPSPSAPSRNSLIGMAVYRLSACASKEDTSWARHSVSDTVRASTNASDTEIPSSNSSSVSVMVIPFPSNLQMYHRMVPRQSP